MNSFAEVIESELNDALLNKHQEAIKRVSYLISEKISRVETVEKKQDESKSDIRLLAENMQKGFTLMDERFKAIDKRFDDVHRRITQQTWFIGSGFILINIVFTLWKLLG